MKNAPYRRLCLAAIIPLLASCGGGSTLGSVRPSALDAGPVLLPAATNSVCITPSTSDQSMTLPTTGGVSATVAIGAYPAGATGCATVTIATGANAPALLPSAAGRRVAAAGTAPPQPILTVALGAGLGPAFGFTTVVKGTQLNTGSNNVFPDGTYDATLTYSVPGTTLPPISLTFTAKNGVVTIASGPLPFIVSSSSTAVIALYDRGVTPPTGTFPTPTPAPPTPSPVPTATPVPTPGPISYGNPPPPAGTILGTYQADYGGTCPQFTAQGCSVPAGTSYYEEGGGHTRFPLYFAFFYGTIKYTFSNPEADQSWTIACPSAWAVSVGLGGGTIIIPPNAAVGAIANQGSCVITYSTLPFGGSGFGYGEVILAPG